MRHRRHGRATPQGRPLGFELLERRELLAADVGHAWSPDSWDFGTGDDWSSSADDSWAFDDSWSDGESWAADDSWGADDSWASEPADDAAWADASWVIASCVGDDSWTGDGTSVEDVSWAADVASSDDASWSDDVTVGDDGPWSEEFSWDVFETDGDAADGSVWTIDDAGADWNIDVEPGIIDDGAGDFEADGGTELVDDEFDVEWWVIDATDEGGLSSEITDDVGVGEEDMDVVADDPAERSVAMSVPGAARFAGWGAFFFQAFGGPNDAADGSPAADQGRTGRPRIRLPFRPVV